MTDKIFIDATETPMGRVGTYAAKQAIQGVKVFVLNCENAIISGNKPNTLRRYREKMQKGGTALKGPYHSKEPEKIMKRAVRGMFRDHRNGRGKEAFRRVLCFNQTPEEYKKEKMISLKKRTLRKSIELKELKKDV